MSTPPPPPFNEEEEEWEKIDESIAALKISEQAHYAQSSVPQAPKLLVRPPAAKVDAQPAVSPAVSLTASECVPVSDAEDAVDPALLSAIDNPRERMVLLQIEDSLLNFVRGREKQMEIPPGLNGFRRLLVYRVAQRFGLAYSIADAVGENGERGICVFKTEATRLPKTLLIDMADQSQAQPSSHTLVSSPVPVSAANNDNASSDVPVGPESTPAEVQAPKKVVMMRRRDNSKETASGKLSGSDKTAQAMTAEERERAYNEARARIFGEEQGSAAAEETSAVSASAGSEKERARESESFRAASSERAISGKEKPTVAAAAISVTNDSGITTGTGSSKKAVDVSAWRERENRSVVRNPEQEKTDPDFARQRYPRTHSHSRSNNYSNHNGSGSYNRYSGGQGGAPQGYYPNTQTSSAPQMSLPGGRYSSAPSGYGGAYSASYAYSDAYPTGGSNYAQNYGYGSNSQQYGDGYYASSGNAFYSANNAGNYPSHGTSYSGYPSNGPSNGYHNGTAYNNSPSNGSAYGHGLSGADFPPL